MIFKKEVDDFFALDEKALGKLW